MKHIWESSKGLCFFSNLPTHSETSRAQSTTHYTQNLKVIKSFFVSTVFWSRKRICTNWAAYLFSQDGFFQFKFLTYYFDLVKKFNESEQEKCTCVTEKVQSYSSWIVHNKFTHFFIHHKDKQQTIFFEQFRSKFSPLKVKSWFLNHVIYLRNWDKLSVYYSRFGG